MRAPESGRRVPVGSWVDPASNEIRDNVFVALAKRAVVLLGETHDEVAHHRWQLHTIAALFGHRPDMVLGFEMFPRVQLVLDRWSKGELDETTFLREVNWPQIWGVADEFYRPHSVSPACIACRCWHLMSIGRRTVGWPYKDSPRCRMPSGRVSAILCRLWLRIATVCSSGSSSTRPLVVMPAQLQSRSSVSFAPSCFGTAPWPKRSLV